MSDPSVTTSYEAPDTAAKAADYQAETTDMLGEKMVLMPDSDQPKERGLGYETPDPIIEENKRQSELTASHQQAGLVSPSTGPESPPTQQPVGDNLVPGVPPTGEPGEQPVE